MTAIHYPSQVRSYDKLQYHVIGKAVEPMFHEIRCTAFEKLSRSDPHNFKTGGTATRLNTDINILNNFTAGSTSYFSKLILQGRFYALYQKNAQSG